MIEINLDEEVFYINCYEILYVNGYKNEEGLYIIDVLFKSDEFCLSLKYDKESHFCYDINSIKRKLKDLL